MNTPKTAITVLAVASLALGLTGCNTTPDAQREQATALATKEGYQDVRLDREDPTGLFGDGTMHFTARVGSCERIEISVIPGQDVIFFENLHRPILDTYVSTAALEMTLKEYIFNRCKAPVG